MVNDSINRELQTPCYVFDEGLFIKNIQDFYSVLHKYFVNSIIGYSFKTNSIPRVIRLAKDNGCFAEVVSDDEYKLAIEIGFNPKAIIFNGPVKEKETFIYAIKNGSLINIDSQREMSWLIESGIKADIGVRINFDLERHMPGHTSTGEQGGRFGFCYENGELHNVICKLKAYGINISRLHMHVSNASKAVEVYQCLAENACKIIEEEKLGVNCIDFGGGYFGGGDNGKQYEKYASAIYETLKIYGMEKCSVIVEPGASVVATCFCYLTSVVDVKKTNYGSFVITDGTRLHIDPFLVRSKYNYSILKCKSLASEKSVQCICGYTCMEKDRIMNTSDTDLQVGDRICYDIVGSYTMCFNPLFITYLPRVYSLVDNSYELIREKWGVTEYIQKCRW